MDHKPLTQDMSKTAEPWSDRQHRQQRQLSYISEFTTDIQHVAGNSNVVADCLSSAVVGAVQLNLDYSRMAVDQAADPSDQALKSSNTGLRLEEVLFSDTGATLLCDVSTGQPRPVVPANWHGLKRDVRAWVDTCTAC